MSMRFTRGRIIVMCWRRAHVLAAVQWLCRLVVALFRGLSMMSSRLSNVTHQPPLYCRSHIRRRQGTVRRWRHYCWWRWCRGVSTICTRRQLAVANTAGCTVVECVMGRDSTSPGQSRRTGVRGSLPPIPAHTVLSLHSVRVPALCVLRPKSTAVRRRHLSPQRAQPSMSPCAVRD